MRTLRKVCYLFLVPLISGCLGQFFAEYVGEVIEPSFRENETYHFEIEPSGKRRKKIVIDSRIFGNIARFVNHSCTPSLTPFLFVRSPKSSIKFPQLGYVFNEKVDADTELTIHYGDGYWNTAGRTCTCGTPNCVNPRRGEDLANDTIQLD
jgi:SET domain-containing protein